MNGFNCKHILGLRDIARGDICKILKTAKAMKEIISRPIKKVPALRGKTVVTLFYENSTRTKLSFDLAAKYLSADTVSLSVSTSSVKKGESLIDTARTVEAMRTDILVMRHPASGAPATLKNYLNCAIVNAGDGMNEHPTQALLDLFTIQEKKGKIEGLRVAIIGDILHSRVARSNIWGLKKLGAEVAIAAPSTLIPPGIEKLGVEVHTKVEEALKGADVVNVLRLQLERQESSLIPSLREYAMMYCINEKRLNHAKDDVLLMHPGPMNRGVEISDDVADSARSAINEQVTNGVAVRMAVLYLLAGGEKVEKID
ncbi:aspartate carbamoyltransferase catalytic subunit [Peptococcaceae bacterium]|nr:aspartate carbamoyltransferase catalytic subunit [Peptococcaceae bacterium]